MRIERDHDVILGQEDLEHLHTFPDFPVFMGCTSAPRSSDLTADMSFWVSRGSGMIQLNPLLPLDVLYPEAHGAGLVGRLWAVHHRSLAEFIGKYAPTSVLEIGGAHGILATNYQSLATIPWTIVEPNPTPVPECKARIIKGFFDDSFRLPEEVDAVVHSHVFEHMYDPARFVRHLAGFLDAGKKLIFSVPNMRVMVDRKYTNCLNFEHTIFLTEEYIEYLLGQHGFRVVERQYFLDDHSIFYAAVRDRALPAPELPTSLRDRNAAAYSAYVDEHAKLVSLVNADIRGRRQVYLFGAHAQAQYLVGFGLDMSSIEAILDNDAQKHGKRLYGTDKLVHAPALLAELSEPTVIVRAGTFTDEIVAQIRGLNPRTRVLL
jgi:SAM-dependent methyltransferase